MAVDLSLGTSGIITFKNGDKFACTRIEKSENQQFGEYDVRIESGCYFSYSRNGLLVSPSSGTGARDIIEFRPKKFTKMEHFEDLKTQVMP